MEDTLIGRAFQNIQVALMIVAQNGEIIRSNHANDQLFGYECGDLMGRSVSSVLPISDMADLAKLFPPLARDAVIKRTTGHKQNGDPVLVSIKLSAWDDPERGPQHAFAVTDIGDSFRRRRKKREELERANNAIKASRIGIFEYNPVNNTVVVSDIWREITGVDATVQDLQNAWNARVHPDDLDNALSPMQVCVDGTQDHARSEHRFLAKDGTHWDWIQTDLAVSRRDKTGRVTRVIGASKNIGDRKTIEDSLHFSQEQFRSAFVATTCGMAIVALDGRNLRVNPALCKMLDYSEAELLETDFQSLLEANGAQDSALITELINEGNAKAYQAEKRFIRSNGAIMWGLLSAGIVRAASGAPEHLVLQIADVTEQRRLAEMKNEFVAVVSHELRSPLTSVLGSLSLLTLMEKDTFSDNAQRLLYIAQENGNRLNALINDILDFEKFSANQMRFNFVNCRVAELVDDALLTNMTLADKYGVKFALDCPNRSLFAMLDPKRFQQVMANLLSNAAKFAEPDSTVHIIVSVQAEFTKISVINRGEGVPEEFRENVFQPFAQAIASSTRKRGGTGLGLNIAKQIIERMGGTIGFESGQDGLTTFWFTVPTDETA
jgi:PAS domain S-box-containing protein